MMIDSNQPPATRAYQVMALSLIVMLAGGCAAFRPTATPNPPKQYTLDSPLSSPSRPGRATPRTAPVLLVNMPKAAPALDTRHMVYIRQLHKVEYFAHSEWVDTPAHMLAPLVAAALEQRGGFRAVVRAPSSVSADLRLDIELLQLQQDFAHVPSLVRFALRAEVIDDATRRLVASRQFETAASAPSDDPYGGVLATNAAVRTVLDDLAAFGTECACLWSVQHATTGGAQGICAKQLPDSVVSPHRIDR